MAVAFDASSESHTGTTSSVSESSFNWTHTPSGAPKGVAVFVIGNGAFTDIISGVTYNGVSMTLVDIAQTTNLGAEPGFCKAYFLGSSIPTGAQTVEVTRTNNTTSVWAVAVSVTADVDTSVAGTLVEDGDPQAITEENINDGSPGTNSLRLVGMHQGWDAPGPVGANTTSLHTIDYGLVSAIVARETTPGQGARPIGCVRASGDDLAAVYFAVIESGSPPVAVAPTVEAGGAYSGVVSTAIALDATVTPGSDASPTYAWTIVSGGTGTFSDATAIDPTFTPDSVATYTLRLTVSTVDTSDVTDDATLTSEASGVWTITNATATFTAVGLGGADATASTLTATAANGSAIASAVTMASGTHTARFFLKRSVGNGGVQITIDGGTTWETISAPPTTFTEYVKTQSSLANPSIGVRLNTSGDSIVVGNAELYLNTAQAEVQGVDYLWTYDGPQTAYRTSSTELTGTWSASTGWTAIADNTRVYNIDEGSGTTLLARDSGGNLVPAKDASVQNSGSGGGGWT